MSEFSQAELEQLRQCGVVFFAGRVIYEAQPPMDQVLLDEVRAQCAGALPPDLLELWALTAGGSLDYELTLEMGGNQEAISWTELFYHGSDHYHDLPGWIEHEQEAAEGPLRYLPIGGFEYCDRVYLCVDQDSARYGEVVVWKMGLPPTWQHALHEDSVAALAPSLKAAFERMWVAEDSSEFESFLGGCELPPELLKKVLDFYAMARPDWRAALQRRELAGDRLLRSLALAHALEKDDAVVLRQVAEAGADFGQPVRGSALPCELALQSGSLAVLELLLDLGAPVAERIFLVVQGELPESLTRRLLRLGARADADSVVRCLLVGAKRAAAVLAEQVPDFEAARRRTLERLQEDLQKVRAGRLGHYLGEKGLQEQISRLVEAEIPG